MTDEAFDLMEIARRLPKDSRYKNPIRVFEEFASACSISRDLETAKQSLITLAEIQRDPASREAFGQALMMHAVITYSRALISRTDNRRQIPIPKKAYNKQQQMMHEAVADLRSTALAHYHKPIGIFAAEWLDDRAVVIRRDGAFASPREVYMRYNFKKVAADALMELIDTAIAYLKQEYFRRSAEVLKVLREYQDDPIFQKAIQESPFDPNKFFPSGSAREEFWRSNQFGEEIFERKPPFAQTAE